MASSLEDSSLKLLDTIIPLTNEWIQPDLFQHLPAQFEIQSLAARIYFLTGLHRTVRLLPIKLYPDPDNRDKLLNEIQKALDETIAEEENTEE